MLSFKVKFCLKGDLFKFKLKKTTHFVEKLKELAKIELSKKVNALFELLDLDKDSL